MKVGDPAPTPCPVDRLVDELGQMCDEAAQVVTTIVIEFPMPFAMVDNVDTAVRSSNSRSATASAAAGPCGTWSG